MRLREEERKRERVFIREEAATRVHGREYIYFLE
jgi:hypothetical protein